MKKTIILFILFLISFMLFPTSVQAEDIIRYTESYEMYTQDASFIPSNEEMQEWFNIDLPRDENNVLIYTMEFNYSEVDFTKPGDYKIVLTFYKRADQKYQKEFNLHLQDYIPEDKTVIGDVEIFYLKQVGLVAALGFGIYAILTIIMSQTQKRYKYVLVVDNKVLKCIAKKEVPSLNQFKKIIKNPEIISCITLNKEDIPKYLEEMIKYKKYDYVIEIKTK